MSSDSDYYKLRIITTCGETYSGEVTHTSVPYSDSCIGLLAEHAPIASFLDAGVVEFSEKEEDKTAFISGGFMEFSRNELTIMTIAAEMAEDIDGERAKAARDRALLRLGEKADGIIPDETRQTIGYEEINVERAEMALKRALLRLDVFRTRQKEA